MSTVTSIHIAPDPGGTPVSLEKAHLVPGRGIEGDHHFTAGQTRPQNEVTLIEAEKVEAFNEETGRSIDPSETRRNIVTQGFELEGLVGKRFSIDAVVLEGMEPCDPCASLGERLKTETMPAASVVQALVDRAGLRARIVSGGWIERGSKIRLE